MGKAVKFASSYAYSAAAPSSAPARRAPPTTTSTTSSNTSEKRKAKKEKDVDEDVVPDADVNVMCLALGEISQQGDPLTGDPVFCSNDNCKAVYNSLSTLVDKDGDKEWAVCEFCSKSNNARIDEAEIPKSSEVDYILEPVAQTTAASDDTSVIFCIDTSGSMCVTCEVEVKEAPKQSSDKTKAFSKFMDKGASQRLPNEKKNIQYISRLQSVQSAVISQIDALHKSNPKKKIGIVTFNDDVQVIGDATQDVLDISGDKLDEYSELLDLGTKYELKSTLDKSKNNLVKKMQSLEEQGGTALGPALLVSVAIAAKSPGSKVIICTDGLANIGLGSMDAESDKEKSRAFYDQLATYAKSVGVTVSVITIAGNECSLENVGKISDATGGVVDIVDPRQIASNFASILEKPVIATHVSATLVAHPAITFEGGKAVVKKDIGNITADSEITLEFSVNASLAGALKEIPFQVQINYRRTNGPLCMRVITVHQPITADRDLAERDVDVQVIGIHVSKKSASLVQDGNYDAARENALANKRMLQRAVHTTEQKELMVQFDKTMDMAEEELDHANATEEGYMKSHALNLDDYDGEERTRMRSSARNDRTAAVMYQMKGEKAAGCVVQ